MLARGALDVFDDLLAGALRCLSHRPLLGGYDEQQTLSWQIALFGPISADFRHNMLGAIGQFETEIRAERQMDGIKKAKDRGVQFGKRPALTNEQIAELREKRAGGTLIKDLMAEYSLSKATIYRYLTENAA